MNRYSHNPDVARQEVEQDIAMMADKGDSIPASILEYLLERIAGLQAEVKAQAHELKVHRQHEVSFEDGMTPIPDCEPPMIEPACAGCGDIRGYHLVGCSQLGYPRAAIN